jgi:hypothetical protein
VPFHYNKENSIYSFDMENRRITVIDPTTTKIIPSKYDQKIQK